MQFNYRVTPIDERLAREVRTTLRAPDYEHPAHVEEIATGYGPCRLCLEKFTVGADARILFTYDPFRGVEPFPLPSPIYIHERESTPYDETSGFPPGQADLPLTFNAYGPGREVVTQERVRSQDAVRPTIERLLGRPSVKYVHVRNTEAGCFICSVTRSEDQPMTFRYDDVTEDGPRC
jgi:hypothetical protein